jgi:MoxR-like ATPase
MSSFNNRESSSVSKLYEEKIRPYFDKRFVKHEEVSRRLTLAYVTGQNIILYGPGGYGKSEMAIAFYEALGIKDPFVKAVNSNTDADELFGGMNMKKFQETGEIWRNVNLSFCANEYVILEEFADMQPNAMASLKDSLTSKKVRNGNQTYNLKTKMIIAITNHDPKDIADDDSLKALLERFPIQHRVCWNTHSAKDYNKMFKIVKGKTNDELSEIIGNANNYNIIPPRTAIRAYEILKHGDLSDLASINGFSEEQIQEMVDKKKKLILVNEEIKVLRSLNNTYNHIISSNKSKMSKIKALYRLSSLAKNIKVSDENFSEYKNILNLVSVTVKDLISELINNEKVDSSFKQALSDIININNKLKALS